MRTLRVRAGSAGVHYTGRDRDEIERNLREAIELYLDELREQGLAVPAPTTDTEYIVV